MKKEKVHAKGPLFVLRRVKTATLGPVLQAAQQQRFRRAPFPAQQHLAWWTVDFVEGPNPAAPRYLDYQQHWQNWKLRREGLLLV